MRTLHRRRYGIAAIVAALCVLTAVAPVAAGSAQAVTIVSHVTFNPDGPNYGDFTATGAAVDNGTMCPAGTFVDTGVRFAGFQSGLGIVQLQVTKVFTCADGSGSFAVKLQIQANFDTGFETFRWVASGDSGLRGSGGGSTVPNPPIGNINTYEGFFLH